MYIVTYTIIHIHTYCIDMCTLVWYNTLTYKPYSSILWILFNNNNNNNVIYLKSNIPQVQ